MRMHLPVALLVLVALLGSCRPPARADPQAPERAPEHPVTARILFAGDVMLGRGVAEVGSADPWSLLEGVGPAVAAADLAVANLESPLTTRPHDPAAGPNALEASPGSAELLRAAGFDAVGIANNHAGDAGPGTVDDTLQALDEAGVRPVGAGRSAGEAFRPVVVEADGLRVAFLALDATGLGPRAGAGTSGVAWWSEAFAREAVAWAHELADVVTVGVHGGLEYSPAPDRYLTRLAEVLGGWGVDVVWGHGPHVIQPVRTIDPDGDGRPTVVATSLGNLLFDQRAPRTRRGALLEVVAGRDGVAAFRVGTAEHRPGPARFRGWRTPVGDAVALDGGWWKPARTVVPEPRSPAPNVDGFDGDVLARSVGDVDADGRDDLTIAFRRPYRPTRVSGLFPRRMLVDAAGRTAHVGVYRPDDLRPRWVAGTLVRPVSALAACHGALAVAYSTLNGTAIAGAGAWRWAGFGFVPMPDLPGGGVPACADVDGDGLTDPVILERSSR
jgi:poly-gamma-glutamate capsule biosynthesis protein CapA/YwtB (metallophosphatase superfamily)